MPAVSDVELVRIGPEDWREFREVRLSSLAESPGAFGARYVDWADADEQRWRSRLADVPFTVVARGHGDGEPVGVVCGAQGESVVELISMWVAPTRRGTGLVDRLVDQVVTWAESHGQETCLMVREDNVAAIRAYARTGFVDLGVPEDWPAGAPRERRMRHGGRSVVRGVTAPPAD